MLAVIEPSGKMWATGEASGIRIPYISWEGTARTYIPDFLIDENLVVEVKPIKLFNSPAVLLKKQAAIEYCELRSWKYTLVDPPSLDTTEIKKLHAEGMIKFLDRYEKLYKERYL
jgi:hypothetical protein